MTNQKGCPPHNAMGATMLHTSSSSCKDGPTKHRRNNVITKQAQRSSSPSHEQQQEQQGRQSSSPSRRRRQRQRPLCLQCVRPSTSGWWRTVAIISTVMLGLFFISLLMPSISHWYWGCPSLSGTTSHHESNFLHIRRRPSARTTQESHNATTMSGGSKINNGNRPLQQDLCFVTCIFGDSVDVVDHPGNVEFYARHWCNTRFLLVTNLVDLPAPGWEIIVFPSLWGPSSSSGSGADGQNNNSNMSNMIIQSREAKFLGWKVLPVQNCGAVMYMDGYLVPQSSYWNLGLYTPAKFWNVIEQVQSHPFGLSQVQQKYFNGLSIPIILNNLVRDQKDTVEHVNTTLEWMTSQHDYEPVMTYYLNKYFAYDPRNRNYQRISDWFWQKYTTYGGSWRDQPLWAYTLHHFNCTPAVLTTQGVITRGGDLFRTAGTIGFDNHRYS